MTTHFETRYAVHPLDAKAYDTERLRNEFLVPILFVEGQVNLVYSMYDRFIVGGAFPVSKPLDLETIPNLKADHFLHRRELGIINVGGAGKVKVDSIAYELQYKEALYLGSGDRRVQFESKDPSKPAKFYLNSAPAHRSCADKKVTLADAERVDLGKPALSNLRTINKLIVNSLVETCQLQMGMTEIKEGSVWNTMPPHVHGRRMEAYFYFEVPESQSICHFMGEPQQTRHIWLRNEQAVLSPSWSIHAAAGTSNYIFIWGMAGENLDYGDMDISQPYELQ
jgi:4-deoxy-L-threo-5-hexosulose-uronate ketol-isomerase